MSRVTCSSCQLELDVPARLVSELHICPRCGDPALRWPIADREAIPAEAITDRQTTPQPCPAAPVGALRGKDRRIEDEVGLVFGQPEWSNWHSVCALAGLLAGILTGSLLGYLGWTMKDLPRPIAITAVMLGISGSLLAWWISDLRTPARVTPGWRSTAWGIAGAFWGWLIGACFGVFLVAVSTVFVWSCLWLFGEQQGIQTWILKNMQELPMPLLLGSFFGACLGTMFTALRWAQVGAGAGIWRAWPFLRTINGATAGTTGGALVGASHVLLVIIGNTIKNEQVPILWEMIPGCAAAGAAFGTLLGLFLGLVYFKK
jgi:hypothetical protein